VKRQALRTITHLILLPFIKAEIKAFTKVFNKAQTIFHN